MYSFFRTLRVSSYLFFRICIPTSSWSDLSNIAFDPNYALFKNTEGNLMYPNPSSKFVHGSDHIVLFEFLGRILGKALYEGSESLGCRPDHRYFRFVLIVSYIVDIDRVFYMQLQFSLSSPISSFRFSEAITPTCIYSLT